MESEAGPADGEWRGEGLVFVGGHARSGTTFLGLLLGHHPDIACWVEPQLLRRYETMAQILGRLVEHLHIDARVARGDLPLDVSRYAPDFIGQFGDRVRPSPAAVEAERHRRTRQVVHDLMASFLEIAGKRILVDKTPQDVTRFRQGMQYLPDAKFIHIVRDARDVACSGIQFVEHYGGYPAWLRGGRIVRYRKAQPLLRGRVLDAELVASVGRQWARYVSDAIVLEREVGADRLLSIRYEDLTASPEAEVKRLLAFVGVEWAPEMDEFLARDQREGVDPASVGRWRRDLSPLQRRLVERSAGPLLADLGYSS